MKFNLLVCLSIILLSACATKLVHTHQVDLDGTHYVLQPIPETLSNTGIQALFKVKQEDKAQQFIIQAEMNQSDLFISAVTAEGLSLFTLMWNHQLNTLQYDKKINIDPLRVLAEFQLVLWPLQDISRGLANATVVLTPAGNREIIVNGERLYEVSYTQDEQHAISTLRNEKHGYSIVVEELARWTLVPHE